MFGPAEDGSNLIQQTGLDLNEAMFGALAELRDFKRGQFGLEKLEQKESGSTSKAPELERPRPAGTLPSTFAENPVMGIPCAMSSLTTPSG